MVPVALARRRNFDIFTPVSSLEQLQQCGLSNEDWLQWSKAKLFSPLSQAFCTCTCLQPACLGIRALGKPNCREIQTSKGHPEATPAIMPIIFHSHADVDILCSGMIQLMATGKYEECESRAYSGRDQNVHSFAPKACFCCCCCQT